MGDVRWSRRETLAAVGRCIAAGSASRACSSFVSANEAPPSPSESIIDVHMHVVESRLPGALDKTVPLPPFDKPDPDAEAKFARKLTDEMKKSGVMKALCMPRCEVSDKDPLGIAGTLAMAERVRGPKLYPVGLVHPERFDRDHLERVEEVLKQGKVKALKAYLGYLHYEPYSPGYRKYFPLAAKYKIPVIFHCGDTYSRTAKVKYAHPLKLDEIAVDYPDTRFVIAHFGNPWLLDAAQVVYKNPNVWIDLSAITIGDTEWYAKAKKDGSLARTARRVKEAIEYTEAPERFLFGSDWPLNPLATYRDFVRDLFPKEDRAGVFRANAENLFGL